MIFVFFFPTPKPFKLLSYLFANKPSKEFWWQRLLKLVLRPHISLFSVVADNTPCISLGFLSMAVYLIFTLSLWASSSHPLTSSCLHVNIGWLLVGSHKQRRALVAASLLVFAFWGLAPAWMTEPHLTIAKPRLTCDRSMLPWRTSRSWDAK